MTTVIHPAAFVEDGAEIGIGVAIGPGAVIGPHTRIGDGTSIGSHALITGWTRIGRGCRIHHGAVLGSPPQDLKYSGERSYLEVGEHTEVREYVTANLATEPEATTRIGIGLDYPVVLANAVQMAGYVTIDDWAIVGGGTVIHQFVRVGRHSMIGGGSRIPQDIAPFVRAAGSPPRLAGINTVGLERRGFSPEAVAALQRAYKILFRGQLTVEQAVGELRASLGTVPEVETLARFAETSARGLTR